MEREGLMLEKKDIIMLLLGLFAFVVAGYRFVVFTGRLNNFISVFITLIGIFLILIVYKNIKRRRRGCHEI